MDSQYFGMLTISTLSTTNKKPPLFEKTINVTSPDRSVGIAVFCLSFIMAFSRTIFCLPYRLWEHIKFLSTRKTCLIDSFLFSSRLSATCSAIYGVFHHSVKCFSANRAFSIYLAVRSELSIFMKTFKGAEITFIFVPCSGIKILPAFSAVFQHSTIDRLKRTVRISYSIAHNVSIAPLVLFVKQNNYLMYARTN